VTKPEVMPRRELKCCDNLHDVAAVDVEAVDVEAVVGVAVVAKAECAEADSSQKDSIVAADDVVDDLMLVQQCAALSSQHHSLKDYQCV
jgi:hypothetical protein